MNIIDVTDKVVFENNDSECLPLTKCVCGKVWKAWDFILGADSSYLTSCPSCGRRFFFSFEIEVYEVRE